MSPLPRFISGSLAAAVLSLAVAGCQPERPDVVPTSAQMVISGRTIHFMVPNDGTAYVYDKPAQRLLWSGRVLKGQSIDVDPQKNQIVVAGSVVANKLLSPSNETDLYFDQAVTPAPVQNQSWNAGPSYNSGVIVTPNATVRPDDGTRASGTVTVQPGLSVVPATQPATP
jgi:hypothetical protein